ncbi:hypothetical protein D9757_015031 [Collybiopsis confluens]|uniref:Uncharacterized protein n=1 Tax=Collybiopsis confluens TaxID=2823264 RepID=A0A8H5CIH1_9AGAR|nr:hypothetical protein D9757_015031 [Collybiopsis confluens]
MRPAYYFKKSTGELATGDYKKIQFIRRVYACTDCESGWSSVPLYDLSVYFPTFVDPEHHKGLLLTRNFGQLLCLFPLS